MGQAEAKNGQELLPKTANQFLKALCIRDRSNVCVKYMCVHECVYRGMGEEVRFVYVRDHSRICVCEYSQMHVSTAWHV